MPLITQTLEKLNQDAFFVFSLIFPLPDPPAVPQSSISLILSMLGLNSQIDGSNC